MLLSSIITIWIVATIITVNAFIPDIQAMMRSAQSIESADAVLIDSSNATVDSMSIDELITDYTPLGVLETLGF